MRVESIGYEDKTGNRGFKTCEETGLKKRRCCDRIRSKEQSRHCKVLASHYIGWEVVRMKFDFKDLMAFGMFILALLTFIIKFCQ